MCLLSPESRRLQPSSQEKNSAAPHSQHLGNKHYNPLQCLLKGPHNPKLFHGLQQRHGQCYSQLGISPQAFLGKNAHTLSFFFKGPCLSFHPEAKFLGILGTSLGVNTRKQNYLEDRQWEQSKAHLHMCWVQTWVAFCHWANFLSLILLCLHFGKTGPSSKWEYVLQRACQSSSWTLFSSLESYGLPEPGRIFKWVESTIDPDKVKTTCQKQV